MSGLKSVPGDLLLSRATPFHEMQFVGVIVCPLGPARCFSSLYLNLGCGPAGGLAAFLHHHGRQPLLRLLRQVAVSHAQGEEEDQVWEKVRRGGEGGGEGRGRGVRQHASTEPLSDPTAGDVSFCCRYTIYSPKDDQPCMDHDRQSGEVGDDG